MEEELLRATEESCSEEREELLRELQQVIESIFLFGHDTEEQQQAIAQQTTPTIQTSLEEEKVVDASSASCRRDGHLEVCSVRIGQ